MTNAVALRDEPFSREQERMTGADWQAQSCANCGQLHKAERECADCQRPGCDKCILFTRLGQLCKRCYERILEAA